MNPMTNMKNVQKLSEQDLKKGWNAATSWHNQYKHSAWVFVGGLPYDLTEGDILTVFSQYGEIVNLNLVRDKKTGKQKGFCFLCYEDQRSTVLAVDNLNGAKVLGRVLRVDHCENYKAPEDKDEDDDTTRLLKERGCAPGVDLAPEVKESASDVELLPLDPKDSLKSHKSKKKKEKKKKDRYHSTEEEDSDAIGEKKSSVHRGAEVDREKAGKTRDAVTELNMTEQSSHTRDRSRDTTRDRDGGHRDRKAHHDSTVATRMDNNTRRDRDSKVEYYGSADRDSRKGPDSKDRDGRERDSKRDRGSKRDWDFGAVNDTRRDGERVEASRPVERSRHKERQRSPDTKVRRRSSSRSISGDMSRKDRGAQERHQRGAEQRRYRHDSDSE